MDGFGQEIMSDLVVSFGSGISCICSRMLAKPAVIGSLDGAEGLASVITSSRGRQVDADTLMLTGWQEVSLPLHLGLSRRHLECPHDMASDFP